MAAAYHLSRRDSFGAAEWQHQNIAPSKFLEIIFAFTALREIEDEIAAGRRIGYQPAASRWRA